MPFYFFWGGFPYYNFLQKQVGTLILTSLLEDLVYTNIYFDICIYVFVCCRDRSRVKLLLDMCFFLLCTPATEFSMAQHGWVGSRSRSWGPVSKFAKPDLPSGLLPFFKPLFFGEGFPFKLNQPTKDADPCFPTEIHRASE